MSSNHFDVSDYARDVVEHLLFGMARARIFNEIATGKSWNVDLPKGAVEIGGRIYEGQILGTFASGSQTFLWAWANPGNANWAPSLYVAKQAQARGQQPGYAPFAQRELSANWVHPREVAHVVGELTGGHPVYAPTTNGTTIFLLVAVPIDPRTLSPAYVPGLLLDFQSIALGHREACVARFFERMGFHVSRAANETMAVRMDARVRVAWDSRERITDVRVEAGAAR